MKILSVLLLFGILSLSDSTTEAIKVKTNSNSRSKICERDFGWPENVPGLYEGSAVKEIDGEAALAHFTQQDLKQGEIAIFYHPVCPHCKEIVKDVRAFAAEMKEKNSTINVIAVNMSKTDKQADELKVNGFPKIRFYNAKNKFYEWDDPDGDVADIPHFEMFAKKNGAIWNGLQEEEHIHV